MGTHGIGQDLIIKYGVKPNQINARALIGSLASITTIIEEINSEVGGGKRLDIKVKAPERGSFLIHLGLVPPDVVDLLKSVDYDSIDTVVKIFLNLFLLRKALSGKKPKKVEEKDESVTITTTSDNTITVDKRTFHIHNSNVTINNSFNQNFETLSADSTIESLEIQAPDKRELVNVPREDFEKMSVRSVEMIEDQSERTIEEVARLHVVKIVFARGRKWEFIYKGRKISANVTDESFLDRAIGGEPFENGDCLEADLRITEVFDEEANTYRHKTYDVIEVRKHIKRSEQTRLDL